MVNLVQLQLTLILWPKGKYLYNLNLHFCIAVRLQGSIGLGLVSSWLTLDHAWHWQRFRFRIRLQLQLLMLLLHLAGGKYCAKQF